MPAYTLEDTIEAILAPGKGILAADESFPSIAKRFEPYKIPSTEENRRAYREMFFSTAGFSEHISGVILFDETLRQKMSDGTPMPEFLAKQGVVPGIKVDMGAVALANFKGEKFTQGLDGLRQRLAEYVKLGARFTKWRAVITIGDGIPSQTCIDVNADALAMFAALSQEAGLVPIVEPEVLMDGDHTIERCEAAITATLEGVFSALFTHRVVLEQMLLKSGMVLSGALCTVQADDATVAAATIRTFRRTVPSAVPGIVFLSGGQSDVEATRRLNAIAASGPLPWKLTFSYGRALQAAALKIWKGEAANLAPAQSAFHLRAKCNGLAVEGKYTDACEKG
jgi:fructose-bisphosphate aldolase, class I